MSRLKRLAPALSRPGINRVSEYAPNLCRRPVASQSVGRQAVECGQVCWLSVPGEGCPC